MRAQKTDKIRLRRDVSFSPKDHVTAEIIMNNIIIDFVIATDSRLNYNNTKFSLEHTEKMYKDL